MKLRAETMLKIDELMAVLPPEDQEIVAFEVWRSYGPRHVEKTPMTPLLPGVFNTNGHAENGVLPPPGGMMGGKPSVPVVKRRDPEKERQALEILAFLNLKTEHTYRPVEENLRFIRARLATCSVEDMKGVIARKTREWLNTKQEVFLRPKTLFNATNFEQYIGEQKK